MVSRGVASPRMAQLALAALICTGLAACGGSGSTDSSATSASSGNNPFAPASATSSTSSLSAATATNKSITLSWSPPTRNSDGSSLTNLAGYTLHYGTASQDYTGSIEITSANQTSYTVSDTGFPPGKYYFAISAYNAQQVSSPLSGEVAVEVD